MIIKLIAIYFLSLVFLLGFWKARKKFFSRLGNSVLLAGWGLHGAVIISRLVKTKHVPLTDMFETLIVFAWLVIMFSFYAAARFRLRWIKLWGVGIALCLLIFSLFINNAAHPLMPSLRSGWLYLHVGAYFIAYASFAISFVLSIVFIGNYLVSKGKNKVLLDMLEGTIFLILDVGFPFLTLGLACGSIWASISWGRFWNWDAKEVWALITWLIYAGCLHLRHTQNLRGINAAFLSIVGFIVIIFTYIGVNLFFPTLHSYR